jgi:hypothetical protein
VQVLSVVVVLSAEDQELNLLVYSLRSRKKIKHLFRAFSLSRNKKTPNSSTNSENQSRPRLVEVPQLSPHQEILLLLPLEEELQHLLVHHFQKSP